MADDKALWMGYDVNAAKKKQSSDVNMPTRKPDASLDKDAFMKLLLTQMQYQDPLNPMDDKAFLSQMAQFSSLEQLQNVAKTFSQQQAYSMIGKGIYAEIYNEKEEEYEDITGIVDYVRQRSGETYVVVGSKEVPVSKVQFVYGDGMAQNIDGINNTTLTSQALSLVGKTVQAVVIDAKQNPVKYVEGKVEHVKFDSKGRPVLVVEDEEVYPGEVISVSDDYRLLNQKDKIVKAEYVGADGKKAMVNGPITAVNIKNGEAYVVIEGKDIFVKNLGLISDALKYIGKDVNYDGVSGKVEKVSIRDGLPYLYIDEKFNEIDFAKFKGIDIK